MAPRQKLSPEAVIEQLREISAQIEEVTPLTPAQRRDLRNRTKISEEAISASAAAIGMSDNVARAIGLSAADVQALQMAAIRWAAVEGELRAFLNGISSANLARRYKLALIAMQAYSISTQLARAPENEHLVPIVEEMKRLRRKRKAAARDKADE